MTDTVNKRFLPIVEDIQNVNREALLISRIIYKVKNQFRRQKHFQILQKLEKMLDKQFLGNLKEFRNCIVKGIIIIIK